MEFLHELTGAQAYLLLCFLLFVEEVGIPLPMLPGDVLLLAGGYLAAIGVVHISIFLVAAYIAISAGAVVCHTVSTHLARRAVLRWGRLVGLTEHRLGIARRWLHRNGTPAVAVARVLPGTRITMSMAAGVLHLPLRDFVLGVIPSSAVFAGTFTIVGFVLGDRVTPLLPWYDRIAVGLAVVAVVAGAIVWVVRRRARRSGADARRAGAIAAQ